MNKITYEMADTWLSELLQLISRYCRYRGWVAISDGLSCMIYAQPDAEARQGRFAFERDSDDLPF